MEELTELMVDPGHQGEGIGRALLERCWPGDPTPRSGPARRRDGRARDLTLYPDFGVMPVAGHWHLRVRTERFLERRAQEVDVREPDAHVLSPARAVEEWQRLEPLAIGHERPALHEFFARDRTCLAPSPDGRRDRAGWVSSDGDIGPAVGAEPEDLVPVVLARSTGWRRHSSQTSRACSARRSPGGSCGGCAARLPRVLAELGHVLGAAAGARPICTNASARLL